MFDDLFGVLFDFNSHGETCFVEEVLFFAIFDELTNDDESDNLDGWRID